MSSQDVVDFVQGRLDSGVTKLSAICEEVCSFTFTSSWRFSTQFDTLVRPACAYHTWITNFVVTSILTLCEPQVQNYKNTMSATLFLHTSCEVECGYVFALKGRTIAIAWKPEHMGFIRRKDIWRIWKCLELVVRKQRWKLACRRRSFLFYVHVDLGEWQQIGDGFAFPLCAENLR